MVQHILKPVLCGCALLMFVVARQSDAGPISYDSQGTFTSNSVQLTSQVIYAVNVGSGAAVTDTATGVVFGADNGSNLGESSSSGVSTNAVFLPGGTTGDAAFDSILNTADFPSGFTHPITYTLKNLTIGNAYKFEILLADTRPIFIGRFFTASQSDGSTPTATQTYAFANGSPDIGGYAIGSFTADATTQSFQLLSSNAPPPTNDGDPDRGGQLNALILTVVPEPASLGTVCVAGLTLLWRRRALFPQSSGTPANPLSGVRLAIGGADVGANPFDIQW